MVLGDKKLRLSDFNEILFNNIKIDISQNALNRVESSHNFLINYCKDKTIYGINTGLGPMAQYHISETDRQQFQYNAIRSHCSGLGERIPDLYIRAAMICSLNAYLKGHSGIHTEVVELLKDLINNGVIPVVPEHGGVGASGDLVQLAHIALVLIGEGEVSFKGKILPTKKVFDLLKLKPISIHLREGLSLINGTYVMTGISIVNLLSAYKLLNWAIAASSMINEIVGSFDDYFSAQLNGIKAHDGQNIIAAAIRDFVSESKMIRKREDYFFNFHTDEAYFEDKVQEYYSVRCVPQILGPVYETLINAEMVFLNESNSSSDNPVIDLKSMGIYHGGNFHGDYVGMETDKMKSALVKLSMLAERQLNFLLNSKLNGKLPPFVNLGKLGVNFGMQGAQFTATSTVAENQTLSFPMSIHSISCNNDNQDIVSMGSNAALITKRVIENSFQVMAIELMTIIQAIDYLDIYNAISPVSKKIYKELRTISPAFSEDTVRYKEIEAIKTFLQSHSFEIIKS